MAMCAVVVVFGRSEELLGLVPGQVGEDAILDIATEESFLGEGHGILNRVVPPAHHPAEEKWAVNLTRHLLIQVELEELLGSSLLHFFKQKLCVFKLFFN